MTLCIEKMIVRIIIVHLKITGYFDPLRHAVLTATHLTQTPWSLPAAHRLGKRTKKSTLTKTAWTAV